MKWPEMELYRICDVLSGYAWQSKKFNYDGQGLPIIRIQNVTKTNVNDFGYWDNDYDKKYLVQYGDLLLSLSGSFSSCLWKGPDALLNQRIVKLAEKKDLVNRTFIHYQLKYKIKKVADLGKHALVSNVSINDLKKLQFLVPPISEQLRIVEILDQADRLRKLRADADAKFQRILPALFIKMFGDPLTNPMGWPIKQMGDLTVDLRYGTSTKCSSNEIGLPVLRIPNVVSGRINLNDLKFVELSKNEIDNLLMEQGDILFVRTNGNRDYVGRCAVFNLDGNYLYASYLIRARLYKKKVDSKFVGTYLSTPTGRQAMAPFIRTTAGQSNISQEGLNQIPIPLPPIEKQKKFCRKVEEVRNLNNLEFIGFEKLDFLFAVLLHHAFNGTLTASWRKAHMKELLQEIEIQAKALAS